ncbi:MAG TPA: hypothetical protein VGY32_02145 [Solirubrobacteraceae bacterium]|nr:hypothetical protein [Solirubrobacteraceae bacterium]
MTGPALTGGCDCGAEFTAYAAAWEPVPDDGLPRHSEQAPG